ncbi:TBC1 domain family member 2A [Alosa alosa]|nr:TBC1 domain family member 2A [Alosa alosa]
MSEPVPMPQLSQLSSQLMTDSSQQPLTTNQTAADVSEARPQPAQRLCGWLEKRGGPLKLWKTRWFSHDAGRSLLMYWRTRQDAMPLGQIELTSATFSYPLEAQDEPGTFYINTPQRIVILKAASHELMMYWLQQLQLIRLQHRMQTGDANSNLDTHTSVEFIPQVKMPSEFVGKDAPNRPSPGLRSPLNLSLKHPIIEFQNLCFKKTVPNLDQAPVSLIPNLDTTTQGTTNQETAARDTPTQGITNQESASQDTPSPDTTNQETTSQDTSSHDTTNQETTSEDTSSHDITNQKSASRETPIQGIVSQETATPDTSSLDTTNQETTSLDTSTHNTANQETASLDTSSHDTANQETSSLDASTHNTASQEAASLETLSEDTANQETASPFTPTTVTANQRSTSLTIPAQIRRRPLSSPKHLSATLPTGRNRKNQSLCLELEVLTQEKEAKEQKELVVSLYKALEASQREKRACADFLSVSGEDQRLEMLRHRERQVVQLKAQVEDLQQQLHERDTQVCELEEALQLMLQKNQAKQEVVLKLSQQLADYTSDTDTDTHTGDTHTHTGNIHNASRPEENLKQENRHLMDDLEAYRTQNKFLNSEIHYLTQLWRQSSQQEKSLMVKCALLEAHSCEKEKRYLSVLHQLRESSVCSETHRQVHTHQLRALIDDALLGALSVSPTSEFDAYGFKLVPDYAPADVQLMMRLNALELRTRRLQPEDERPLVARWEQLLSGSSASHCPSNPAHLLCPSLEIKSLLRAGVPQKYRRRVWRWLVWVRTRAVRESSPDRYHILTQNCHLAPRTAAHQIQLDLHRTLTTNQRFSSPSSPIHEQLRRVLLAFACHNPTVGYCQGFNRLAALALLVLEDEEEAFWCLVAIIEAIMPPDYFSKSLLGCQVDQCVFKELLADKVPRVNVHLEAHSVDVVNVSLKWFPVIFLEELPSDILFPLWDAFLYEGSKVILRYALALLKYKEDEILKMQNNTDILQYLFFFPNTITDVRKLRNIAFGEINPLTKKYLRSKRAWHRQHLEAELQEREAELREQSSQHAERHDKALDDIASDDDELN